MSGKEPLEAKLAFLSISAGRAGVSRGQATQCGGLSATHTRCHVLCTVQAGTGTHAPHKTSRCPAPPPILFFCALLFSLLHNVISDVFSSNLNLSPTSSGSTQHHKRRKASKQPNHTPARAHTLPQRWRRDLLYGLPVSIQSTRVVATRRCCAVPIASRSLDAVARFTSKTSCCRQTAADLASPLVPSKPFHSTATSPAFALSVPDQYRLHSRLVCC